MLETMKAVLQNKKLVGIVIGSIVFVIIIIAFIFYIIQTINKKVTYAELEDQLIAATENYMKSHPELLPTKEKAFYTVSDTLLVEEKYIKKEIGKLVKDNCSAEIEVQLNNGAYHIKPLVTCDNYKTALFYDKVLIDYPVTNDGNGLYDLNDMIVFRGDRVNNYVNFHNTTWRIVKMNPADATIYLILENLKSAPNDVWDNRYNTTEESKHGINNYSTSIALETLENIYNTQFTNLEKALMVPMSVCIGKRSKTESINDGSIECSNILNKPQYISLLPLYDYLNASTDYQCRESESRACSNYNYLVNKAGKWWTLTADGSRGNKVYSVNYTGVISSDYADAKKYNRFVIAVDGTSIYRKGNGTQNDPYVFK